MNLIKDPCFVILENARINARTKHRAPLDSVMNNRTTCRVTDSRGEVLVELFVLPDGRHVEIHTVTQADGRMCMELHEPWQ